MKCQPVVNYKRHLDSLFDKVSQTDAFTNDPELLSQWGKYLSVLVAGFLEVAVREIYAAHASRKAAPHIASFVRQRMARVQNVDSDRIYEIARWFGADWEAELRGLLDVQHEGAVNGIVGNRKQIAHGNDQRSSVTFAQVRDWYKLVVEVVETLEMQCER